MRIEITGRPPYWQAAVYRGDRVALVYFSGVFWKYRPDDAHVPWWLAVRCRLAVFWQGRGIRRAHRLAALQMRLDAAEEAYNRRWAKVEKPAELPSARLISD